MQGRKKDPDYIRIDGQRLKHDIKSSGLKFRDIGKALHISASALTRWTRKNEINKDILEEIYEILDKHLQETTQAVSERRAYDYPRA